MRILTSLLVAGLLLTGCSKGVAGSTPVAAPESSQKAKTPAAPLDTNGKPCTTALASSVSFTCDGIDLQSAIDGFLTSHPCILLGREIRYVDTEGRMFMLETDTKKKECHAKK